MRKSDSHSRIVPAQQNCSFKGMRKLDLPNAALRESHREAKGSNKGARDMARSHDKEGSQLLIPHQGAGGVGRPPCWTRHALREESRASLGARNPELKVLSPTAVKTSPYGGGYLSRINMKYLSSNASTSPASPRNGQFVVFDEFGVALRSSMAQSSRVPP